MSIFMDFTCPDSLSPESNNKEAPLLEKESDAKGAGAEAEAEDEDDEFLNSENFVSDYFESQHLPQPSASKPWFSSWLTQYNKPTFVVGAGLENLGNTCFLNSVMQCFIHTVPLFHGILSDKHSNCHRDFFCVVCALRELIYLSLTWKNGPVAPMSLVENMNYFSSGFQRFQQEDAHEFLQCFLDRLESCQYSSQSDSIVKRVFGGRLVSKLKCCNCGHCSDTYEPSIDLSLEIEDAADLLTSLQSFTKVENIEDPEIKFTCEECKEQVSIEKQLSFDQTPSVAVFQLKRFKTDGCLVEKIDKHVAFPLELDLLPFTAGARESDIDLKYNLYAIVVHVGWTSTSGHYYCFICISPNVWCKFDDSRVELVTEEYVLSQEAYLLFYAKEGTQWFSSFIETQTYFNVDLSTCNTSPKSVLDRIDTSPGNSTSENKLTRDYKNKAGQEDDIGLEHSGVDNNNEMKESGRIMQGHALVVPCNVPSPEPHIEISPTLQDNVNCPEKVGVTTNCQTDTCEVTPLRSPSPEIYREDPPDAGFSIPLGQHLRKAERITCKRRLEKDMDDLETRQACSLIKKSMPGSRGQQMLAALRGSKTEPSVNRKKVRKSGEDGSSIRPAIRPLFARTRR